MESLKNDISNVIHDKLRLAYHIVKISKGIKEDISIFPECMKNELGNFSYDLSLDHLLLKETISLPSSLFRNKGCILSTYWNLRKKMNLLRERIKFIGFVDAYFTLSEYLKNLDKLPWTFSVYGNEKKKKLVGFWNPGILNSLKANKKPTLNSLKANKKTNMVIITGPNAGGKSTYVKTIFINSILSQTFGVVFAKKWNLPNVYSYMDTYFNVPDIEGKLSTFQAEMKRCYSFIKNLNEFKGNENSLIALDEVLTSTNFKEAISGASSILKNISSNFENVLCIVTTHYHCLSMLECDTIKNYCVRAEKKDGKIYYPFKMKRGVSKDHVALDLLEKEGFSEEILKCARNIYEKINLPDLRFLESVNS